VTGYRRDPLVALANIQRVDAHLHRRLPADSELCQAIAVLARAHQDAIWARTKAHHQLGSVLCESYPTFLAVFTSRFTLGPQRVLTSGLS
jgi:hypothetical protein